MPDKQELLEQKARAFDAIVAMLKGNGKFVRTERRMRTMALAPSWPSVSGDDAAIGADDVMVIDYVIRTYSNEPLINNLLQLGEVK